MLSTRAAPRRLLVALGGRGLEIKMSDLVYLRAAASHGSVSALVTSGCFAIGGFTLHLNGGLLFHAAG